MLKTTYFTYTAQCALDLIREEFALLSKRELDIALQNKQIASYRGADSVFSVPYKASQTTQQGICRTVCYVGKLQVCPQEQTSQQHVKRLGPIFPYVVLLG